MTVRKERRQRQRPAVVIMVASTRGAFSHHAGQGMITGEETVETVETVMGSQSPAGVAAELDGLAIADEYRRFARYQARGHWPLMVGVHGAEDRSCPAASGR
ncbi:hypothetical protein P3T35_004395 [Kitasatospora sp. GP30]|nr:hypothetical protein [Kitasatospora sp. GP30]